MKHEMKMAIMKKAQEIANTSLNEESFLYEGKIVKVDKPSGVKGKRFVNYAKAGKENTKFVRLGYISDDCIHIMI